MFDLQWIRENPEAFDRSLQNRRAEPVSARVLALDSQHRTHQTSLQEMQARRNQASKEIGKAMAGGDTGGADTLKAEVGALKAKIAAVEEQERAVSAELDALLAVIPNILADDVPIGDESANKVLRTVGTPTQFDFAPKEHFDIGEGLGLMDFETASAMSGSRFVILTGALARLERALAQFMLDIHTSEFGYTEVSTPMLVRDSALYNTGQLPKMAGDQFVTTEGHYLIPTAEVPLTNMVAGRILDESELPVRVTAWTGCFRSEAGAAGKDTRGMLRQHQFYKVELVSITHPDESDAEQERMAGCAEAIIQRLELPYQMVLLASGDTGNAARRTFDIEVWLPGQGVYREISSCSTTGEFQARRMKARFRPKGAKGTRFVHTLNGSGVAVGRALIAILENFQHADGSVTIPQVLRPYMGGMEIIKSQ
ncbi:MAG: serine--tRNA ligase [Alphaproteobacteria bacterium]